MTSNWLFLIGGILLVSTIIWSYWYERYVTNRQPPAGKIISTTQGDVHVIVRSPKAEVPAKTPIVLIHGSTTNALDMDFDLADRLSDDRMVVMPDRPGHGFTPRRDKDWRLDAQARQIRALLKEMKVERPIIFGQSYGGAVALQYAFDFPDEMSGMVLVAPVSHRWPGGVAWYNRVGINPMYGRLFRRTFIALYGRYGSSRGVARALHGSPKASLYHQRTRVALTFRPTEFRHNAEDIVRLYEQLVAMDQRYGEITAPTEIVSGTHDMTVLTSVHSRGLEQAIKGANLQIIDGGGHALHHTHAEDVMNAIDRLDQRLASLGRSPLEGALRRLSAVFPRSGT